MTNTDVVERSDEEIEEWILSQLEAEPMPVPDLLGLLAGLQSAQRGDLANSCAELLQEALIERNERDAGLELIALRAQWHGNNGAFRKVCASTVFAALGKKHHAKILVKNSGFEDNLPLDQCFDRLQVLVNLAPGKLCLEKTWGFGVVSDVDDFYERVHIDFDKKRGHELSMAYAAETLELLDDGHLLAVNHSDRERMKGLIENEPGEVVKLALLSYGPMSAARLQEVLTETVLAGVGWKRFWDDARKALKSDPCVEFPAKRNDPIVALDSERSFDDSWLDGLRAERAPRDILRRLDDLRERMPPDEWSDEIRAAAGERLAHVVGGGSVIKASLTVQSVILADEFAIPAEILDIAAVLTPYLAPKAFYQLTGDLSARNTAAFMALLGRYHHEALCDLLIGELNELSLVSLTAAMDYLLESDQADRCREAVGSLFRARRAGISLLYWLAKKPQVVVDWSIGSLPDLSSQILRGLEAHHSGEQVKARNNLRALLGKRSWLKPILESMDDIHRRDFMGRLRDCAAWPRIDRQIVLMETIRLYPELEAVLVAEGAETEAPAERGRGRFTSWRSHRERQAQLEKLVNVDIPQNSKDIGVARSYGDLRENFEYQSAKDHQGLLMTRKSELENDLSDVRGTDFVDFAADAVGMGTEVTVRHAGGHEEHFVILGEWDQDETLGIISSETAMAKALAGRKPGDEVSVPAGDAPETVTIVSVTGLSDPIKDWIGKAH